MKKLLLMLMLMLMLVPFWGFSQFVHVSEEDGLLPNAITFFVEGLDGSIWTGGENGVSRNQSGIYQNFTSNNGLVSNFVTAMALDQNGNIWVGSMFGISVFNGSTWTQPSYGGGSSAQNIKDIEIADNGDVWLATGSGIWVYDGADYSALTIAHGLPTNNIKHLAKTTDGTLWAGTSLGLCRYNNPDFTVLNSDFGLSSNNIIRLAAGDQVYAYCSNVLNVFNGFSFSHYENLNPASNASELIDIHIEANQDVWLAFAKDLVKFHNMELVMHLHEQNTNLYKYWDMNSPLSMPNVKSFGLFNGKLFLGFSDGYRYTYDTYLIPENISPNTDTLNVNNRTFWGSILGMSDRVENPNFSTINMFLAGMDEDNQLHMSGGLFERDWAYGPVSDGFNTFDHVMKWHRNWKLNKNEIDYHKINWGQDNYEMPYAIEHWPDISDYLDSNANGIYDPENGDYPIIRGDQALLNITNDNLTNHIGRQKMKVEIQALSYAYQSEDSALNNTVFTNYKVQNKSLNNYTSVYLSIFNEVDIGWYWDDYVGTDTSLNAYYVYNADNEDDVYGVGNIPADGVVFLNTKMTSTSYYNGVYGNYADHPISPIDYYNYLLGYWMDGSAMTYGGNAYDGDSAVKYVFTGDPLSNLGWTEISAGNEPGDRQMLGVVGPFNLEAGQDICIDVAFVRGTAWGGSHIMSLKELKNRISHVHSWYANQGFTCDSIMTVPETELAVNALEQQICASALPSLVQLPTVMYGGAYPFTYEWGDETGTYFSNQLSPSLWAPESTTDYYVTVTDHAGATVTDTLTLTVNQGPWFDLGNDMTLLDIENLELNPNLGVGIDYLWSTGSEASQLVFNGYIGEGEYDVWLQATDEYGCLNVDSIHITVEFLTSVKAVDDYMVKIYPNPSAEIVNVELPQKSSYLLFNILGETIQQGVFNASTNQLKVSQLSKGTYFLYIESLNLRKKLVIQ